MLPSEPGSLQGQGGGGESAYGSGNFSGRVLKPFFLLFT